MTEPVAPDEQTHQHLKPKWRSCRVKDVLDFHNTRRVPLSAADRGAMTEKRYDYYGASGIIDKVDQYLFDGTYILIAEDGANLLSRSTPLAFVATGQFWVNNHAHILKPRVDGDIDFFVNLLESIDYSASVTGAAQPKLTMQNLGSTRLSIPSVEEQQRIASYIANTCRAINAAVSSKRRQLVVLDDLRKATIQRVVTKGLQENGECRVTGNVWMDSVPKSWSLVCLKRISELQGGLTLGKEYIGPLIERPYLRVANVQDGRLDLDDVSTIEVPVDVAARVELRKDDVLMTEGGDLDKLGRGFLWNGEIDGCLHQNHIFALRCFRHKLLPKFLTYVTASKYGRDYFEATGKRTTNLASTNSTKVGEFPIPLPSVKEQEKFVEYLDAKLDELKTLQGMIETQVDTLLAYRKSLIHECVTGQRKITEWDLKAVSHA